MNGVDRARKLVSSGLKLAFLPLWCARNSSSGNAHLPAVDARVRRIPFHRDRVFLRPTESDSARVNEFVSKIYFKRSYLHNAVKNLSPTTVIDIGANIGLSSLSLVKEFEGVRRVYAIEAESFNFEVLKMNFELWSEKYPDVEWVPIHAAATHTVEEVLCMDQSLHDLTRSHSASGTFRFVSSNAMADGSVAADKVLSVGDLVASLPSTEKIIVKIDIEGGEEHLFKSRTEWLTKCALVAVELHDEFHPKLFNSSRLMMQALVSSDFAFVPSTSILHCYNRSALELT